MLLSWGNAKDLTDENMTKDQDDLMQRLRYIGLPGTWTAHNGVPAAVITETRDIVNTVTNSATKSPIWSQALVPAPDPYWKSASERRLWN